MSASSNFISSLKLSRSPGTWVLIFLLVATFLVDFFTRYSQLSPLLALTDDWLKNPWSVLTTIFANNMILGVIFGSLWIYSLGNILESDLGTKKFLGICAALVAIASFSVLLGMSLTQKQDNFDSIWMLTSIITVIWGSRYPDTQIRYFTVCIAAKWIAWISALMVFFTTDPLLAPFAVLSLVVAHFFARNRLPIKYSASVRKSQAGRGTQFYSDEYYDEVRRREKERDEKERLRKLFESSIKDDEN